MYMNGREISSGYNVKQCKLDECFSNYHFIIHGHQYMLYRQTLILGIEPSTFTNRKKQSTDGKRKTNYPYISNINHDSLRCLNCLDEIKEQKWNGCLTRQLDMVALSDIFKWEYEHLTQNEITLHGPILKKFTHFSFVV